MRAEEFQISKDQVSVRFEDGNQLIRLAYLPSVSDGPGLRGPNRNWNESPGALGSGRTMSSHKLTIALSVLLIGVSALTAYFAWQNVRMTGRWQQLADTEKLHRSQEASVNRLVQDVVAYGRKHPDILPVLETVGIRFRTKGDTAATNNAATNNAASKPSL